MTLKDCTKAELLTVIDLLKRHLFTNGDYYLLTALHEVERQRLNAKMDKADKLAELASQKRQEYIDLLKPYDGKKYSEIPYDVLAKARNAHVEAQKLDEEWNKLMGYN